MKFKFNQHSYVYQARRSIDKDIAGELKPNDLKSDCQFTEEGKILFIKALKAAAQSSLENSGKGKTLPLQGVIDLNTQQIHIGALTPRDANSIIFNEEPLFEHKKPGLFEAGQYSPRIESYQRRYSDGPSAHQQLLYYVANKQQVSADDAKDKRGFAINISVTDKEITIIVDGNSLSINETAQYLRTLHAPGHVLSEEEAHNDVLKAAGIYSQFCEAWILDLISDACRAIVAQESKRELKAEYVSANQSVINSVSFFGGSAQNEEDSFDKQLELLHQLPDSAGDLPKISAISLPPNDDDNPSLIEGVTVRT